MLFLKEAVMPKFDDFLNMIMKNNRVKKVLYSRDEIFAQMFNAKIERVKHSAKDDNLVVLDGRSELHFHLSDLKAFDDTYARLGHGLYSLTFNSGAVLGLTF